MSLQSGRSSTGVDALSGLVTLASGESSGCSGDANIASGVTTSSESSGSVILQTGSSQAGAAGNVVLAPGSSAGGDGAWSKIGGGSTVDPAGTGGGVGLTAGGDMVHGRGVEIRGGTTGPGVSGSVLQAGEGSKEKWSCSSSRRNLRTRSKKSQQRSQ